MIHAADTGVPIAKPALIDLLTAPRNVQSVITGEIPSDARDKMWRVSNLYKRDTRLAGCSRSREARPLG